MDQQIHYAVIALTKEDAEKLISSSEEEKTADNSINKRENKNELNQEILNYLKSNYKFIYGDSPDDWKPFKEIDKSISQIIDLSASGKFESETDFLCDTLDKEPDTNLTELLPSIEVLFIDVFALYMDKYSQFSIRADYACDRGERHICCFVIDLISLSKDGSGLIKEINEKRTKIWSSVSFCYSGNSTGASTGRCDNEVTNTRDNFIKFITYLKPSTKIQGVPSIRNYEQANKTFGPYGENPTTPPRLGSGEE